MNVVVPCDIVETRKATDYLLLKHVGPKRSVRPRSHAHRHRRKDSVHLRQANAIRLRHEAANFIEALETKLESEYRDECEDLTIAACGPMVPEAMRAAWILKQDFGYETLISSLRDSTPSHSTPKPSCAPPAILVSRRPPKSTRSARWLGP